MVIASLISSTLLAGIGFFYRFLRCGLVVTGLSALLEKRPKTKCLTQT